MVRGTMVVTTLAFVNAIEENGLERIKKEATKPLHDMLAKGDIDINSWYPMKLEVEFLEIMDRVFGKGNGDLVVECGRYSANYIMGSLQNHMLKYGRPDLFVSRAGEFWSMFYNWGRIEILENEDNKARIRVVGGVGHDTIAHRIKGWCERCLEIIGCVAPEVEIKKEGKGRNSVMVANWNGIYRSLNG